MSRRLWKLASTVMIVALASAGCGNASTGGDSSGDEAGSRSGTAASTSGAKQLTKQEQGVKWAECMRTNGVSDFPDPDPNGEINYGVSVSAERFQNAVNACKALEPPGALSSKRNTEQQSAVLQFAQCVRDHGVKDFPDPVNGQPVINTDTIPSANRPGGMNILNAATDACGRLIAGVVGQK